MEGLARLEGPLQALGDKRAGYGIPVAMAIDPILVFIHLERTWRVGREAAHMPGSSNHVNKLGALGCIHDFNGAVTVAGIIALLE